MEIEAAQWEAVEELSPGWQVFPRKHWHQTTRASLVRRGWVEVRDYGFFFMARLSFAGRVLRDEFYRERAERAETARKRALWRARDARRRARKKQSE
jgi:hypothetical protein